ncbi:thiopurine S-methyltransferase [Phaeobacter gallaeciensis]|uniref:Thiopurine S-methyltransferase n=2 Tax=Roseobacteraceae TaxID=2854170 RepID=A0A366X2I4_9RHOB|nr:MULTISPECIES: thiopurine S-methyltransferase [Roseobacteraceae]MBT3143249.1 thiopurine S-methyltransferase [Falsiruegeria litorea]MBT8167513.1 thiopurine S-methyltransferase [Falsiruegeria litorea]RBW57901.1 thiopurine S-methyltransferase [Phaeobacter gallaeciensis]
MTPDFWHDRWQTNRIGFHEAEANRLLVAHFSQLEVSAGDRVFLPLCGKTRDVAWLLAQGLQVVGAELSRLAIEQLFEELELVPDITELGPLTRFEAQDITMFVGDIFDLDAQTLGRVDAIYDRAALVALPQDMRARYSQHLITITGGARQLLISFDYDQSRMDGPPFSVQTSEITHLYAGQYSVVPIARTPATDRMQERCDAIETVWVLR